MLKNFFQGRIFNLILVYAGWVLCLHQVVHGHPYVGTLAVFAVLTVHFILTRSKWPDFKLLLAMILIGTALDSLYIALGILKYNGDYSRWLAPAWVTALWALLSISINHSMRWMKDSLWMAALFGAVGAPATYLACVKLGAGTFMAPKWIALGVIGAAWFITLPLLFKLSSQFEA